MARQKYYVGSVGPLLYDDAALINDPDGDLPGEDCHALATPGQLLVESDPTNPHHVLRLDDYYELVKSYAEIIAQAMEYKKRISNILANDIIKVQVFS